MVQKSKRLRKKTPIFIGPNQGRIVSLKIDDRTYEVHEDVANFCADLAQLAYSYFTRTIPINKPVQPMPDYRTDDHQYEFRRYD